MIDVLLPVFNAAAALSRCLESLLMTEAGAPYRLHIIDDGSSDPAISERLARLETGPWCQLIIRRNAANLGFIRSINHLLEQSTADVVILNSDTAVTQGWLGRLVECAESDPRIATITPFSNNAEICSYPKLCSNQPIERYEVAQVAEAAAQLSADEYLDLPTGVGFCMFMRRGAIQQLGIFDEAFGPGYGEENDFCMRALQAGWRNVLCHRAFIVHQGGVSFAESKRAQQSINAKLLSQRYPDYDAVIRDFIERDPVADYRHRLGSMLEASHKDRFGRIARPAILMVSHAFGGGVAAHVDDLSMRLAAIARVEHLHPCDAAAIRLVDEDGNEQRIEYENLQSNGLLKVLQERHYQRVHIHNLHGHQLTLLQVLSELSLPTDITIHDFAAFCPQYALIDERQQYCGEPDQTGCQACLDRRPHAWATSIEAYREIWRLLLLNAARVFAPSMSVAERLSRHFPATEINVLPHAVRLNWSGKTYGRIKILVLGALSVAKGLKLLEACAQDAVNRDLPLAYTVLGYTGDVIAQWPELPVSVRGEYVDAQLPDLADLERADLIWFPGRIPETYSYTLDVALALGTPIAYTDIGAVAERLEGLQQHIPLDFQLPANEINDRLLSALPFDQKQFPCDPSPPAIQVVSDALDRADAMVVQPLDLISGVSTSLIAQASDMSLPTMFEFALQCGNATVAQVLQSRLQELEEQQQLLTLFEQSTGHRWFEALDHLRQDHGWEKEINRLEDELGEVHQGYRFEIDRLNKEIENRQNELGSVHKSYQCEIDRLNAELRKQYEGYVNLSDQVAQLTQELMDVNQRHRIEVREETKALEELLLQTKQQQNHQLQRIEKLKSEVTLVMRRLSDIEQSTFWRMTAPMRHGITAFRRRRARLIEVFRRALQLNQKWGTARSILLNEGFIQLVRRTSGKLRPTVDIAPPVLANRLSSAEPLQITCCPAERAPRVSIVIPTFGQHEHTFNCLRSIAEHTDTESVELVVLDDAFTDPLIDALSMVRGPLFHRNEANMGFLLTCQRGAELARGEYLVLLNNDVEVQQGWLDALLGVLERDPQAGLVGAKLVYPDGRLQEAGGIVWQDGSAWNWGRGEDQNHPYYNYVREVDYCSGACLMLRKAEWDAMGGFDTDFCPAYYEDTDLAQRVIQSGKKVIYQPAAVVVHYEGISCGTDENAGIKQYQSLNQKTFIGRWRDSLKHHRSNGFEPRLEADRNRRPWFLVIDACMLEPDKDSGSVRMLALLEILVELGCKVVFAADNLECRQPYVSMLQQRGVEVWHTPHVSSVTQLLQQQGPLFDHIMICRHYIAAPYLANIRDWAPKAQIIFDTIDLHYLREQRLAALEDSDTMRAQSSKTREQELYAINASDVTLVVSPAEVEVLKKDAPEAEVRVLSNIHEPVVLTPSRKARDGVLFVGGFQHPPNVDAVNWLVKEIWPSVHRAAPELQLRIVGSKMPDKLRKLAGNGVEILGFVEDLEPLLQQSLISVAPLRYGAGVKGKVNQAMAYGLPVVATPAAVEGMGVNDGTDVLVAETPMAFAEAILRLRSDPVLWDTVAAAGKDNIRGTFSRAIARETLRALIQKSPMEMS